MGKIKLLVNTFGSALTLLAIASVVVYAQSVWTPPTATPPGDNTPAPVNVGASNQVKIGGLGVGPLAVFGNAMVTGDLDVSGIYKDGGRPGITAACPAGQTLTAFETRGGIVVGGSCGAAGGGGGGGGTVMVTTVGGAVINAVCPAGKKLTGGGCSVSPNVSPIVNDKCRLLRAGPYWGTDNIWQCQWKQRDSSGDCAEAGAMAAYAFCQ